MKYPDIAISTGITGELEAQYICFIAKNITLKRYSGGNYYVLPHQDNGNQRAVFFPNLPYSKNFWRVINFCASDSLSHSFPKEATGEVRELLSKYKKNTYQKECLKIAEDWKKIENKFFNDIDKFLNFKMALSKIEKINILITPFGTLGSFNPPRVGNNFNLIITSRVDFPAGNIGAGILQNLYIVQNKTGGEIGSGDYLKRMSAIEFIFKNTVFSKYYPSFENPDNDKFSVSSSLPTKSNAYLKKLGFPQEKIDLLKSEIFSPQEGRLLKCLQEKKGKIVSFDQTSQILWGRNSYDKYSPQAMAKVIENIRRKIKDQGINKEVIFTKRGKGYSLFI